MSREGTALNAPEDATSAGDLDWDERTSLSRVAGLHHDATDISEVEYRQLRLERVFLVGLASTGSVEDAEISLRELAALAETAGSQVLGGVVQRRRTPDPATFIGSGKARELASLVADEGADTVIVDSELHPSQRRGLEDVVKVKVIDRTALILDIFAQHARSREGKAQVELAQLTYLLPRLRGWGESMSRQAGGRVAAGAGIGSRGPGETKIELDRRRINQRMAKLRREIAHMKRHRETSRATRRARAVPAVAIAGYTNAGKSSLLNRLTGDDVLVHNALFATLDPTVRHARTPDGRDYTLTDTVGFVSRLPHELVEAFRSTLEEIAEADVIVHVVDAAHPDPLAQIRAVTDVLATIPGASEITSIIALNKADLASPVQLASLRAHLGRHVVCSALTGQGIDELRALIAEALPRPHVPIDALIPFSHLDLVSRLHTEGEIDTEDYTEQGVHIVGRARPDLADALREARRTP
nr:GTPase HflX [Nanchangia anserum]